MHTPEYYLPGTSDNPKTGRKTPSKPSGKDYLMPQNPFIEAGGHFHAEIPTPEEAILRREDEGENIWEDNPQPENETSQEDTWMEFVPAGQVAEDEGGSLEETMDFGPVIESINKSRIPTKVREGSGKPPTDRGIVRIQREAVITEKRKNAEKRKAA